MADLQSIAVLAELERCGIAFEWSTQDEIKICCPFHDDKTPSCHVNINKRVFRCQTAGCNADGDIVALLARYLKTTRAVVLADLGTRYSIEDDKIIDPQLIQRYHAAIWKATVLLNELHKRGVTDALIRQYRLGEHEGRIQIPIPNDAGHYVNIRKYLPGAPGKDKMRNAKTRGQMRLFPIEQLKYDKILVTGGECKAIVAADQLNRYGIGAICATSGEGNWERELTERLKDKRIWVCLDTDAPGKLAAYQRCLQLSRVATWLGEPIALPLDPDRYPKGDINDFVASEHGELKPLLDAANEFKAERKTECEDTGEPLNLELTQAVHADVTAKRIAIKAVVSAMDTSPYIVPKELEIFCPKDLKECAACPVFLDDNSKFKIAPESPALLELVNAPKNGQIVAVKSALGIPQSCRVCEFKASSYYNVEDARISPQLEITNRAADRVMQPAYCIGDGMELNESYNLVGRMYPNPKTQQSTLLISKYATTQDALSTYKCERLDELAYFWPEQWDTEGIQQRLDAVYADFEANVTRIFQRRALHLAIDLAYHSPLFFQFDGSIRKGWVETLILGDSAQGKSETTLCLQRHYGLGEIVECKNATVAGLLGGLQQMGSRWFVSWGVIPTHDKRLVILEELKGTSQEVIGKLTDMRSRGIAEIPKIEKRKTHARTRLIALSNPRSDMKLSQYNFGIEAIKELIGGLEDVRRFDFALLVSSDEIDVASLNTLQQSRPQIQSVYTSERCRNLILWAWTRRADQIIFDDDTTGYILEQATKLCEKFTDAIPLVDRGSMRLKLARLASSLAARTFSCSEDYQSVVVYPCHVEYIVKYLQAIYSSSVFGYLDYTRAIEITQTLVDPEQIIAAISRTPYPSDLCKQLIAKNKIDLQDLCDWCGWERQEATELLSVFVRKHALVRDGKAYRKTAKFISLLKDLLERGGLKDRPAHIKPAEY